MAIPCGHRNVDWLHIHLNCRSLSAYWPFLHSGRVNLSVQYQFSKYRPFTLELPLRPCGSYFKLSTAAISGFAIFQGHSKMQPNSPISSRCTCIPYAVMRTYVRLIIGILVEFATSCLVFASDALLLVVTWYKTINTHRTAVELGMKTPLTTLLLRDGRGTDWQSASFAPLTCFVNRNDVFFWYSPVTGLQLRVA